MFSTDFTHRHPLQGYWQLAGATVQADALSLALELGVFQALREPLATAILAERLVLHPANTGYLLELLWSMGLLQRTGGDEGYRYGLSDLSRQYFLPGPDSCIEAWHYRVKALRQAGAGLRARVLGDALPPPTHEAQAWAAAVKHIAQEQRAISVPAVLQRLSLIPEVQQARRLLDLGGGPGLVAQALVTHNPHLHATLFDWPVTLEVARELIIEAGLAARIDTLGGDLASDSIGAGYDLIWCSSVLHFVPDPLDVLRRVHAALEPGGLFICAHAERSEHPAVNAGVLTYYLPMLLAGRFVGQSGQLSALLTQAGFTRVEHMGECDFPMAPVTVLLARKVAV
ncbi:class I SAM-dependent methyltransferase [Pseudomonas sp. 3A(2025)]